MRYCSAFSLLLTVETNTVTPLPLVSAHINRLKLYSTNKESGILLLVFREWKKNHSTHLTIREKKCILLPWKGGLSNNRLHSFLSSCTYDTICYPLDYPWEILRFSFFTDRLAKQVACEPAAIRRTSEQTRAWREWLNLFNWSSPSVESIIYHWRAQQTHSSPETA